MPDPAALARRGDAFATRGRAVFPILPPGVRAMPVDGHVARFQGEKSLRLLAQIETRGWPDDTLSASWVVLDSAAVEVARGRSSLEVSACDPARLRVADFIQELPAGRYEVGMEVSDGKGRRGVFRDTTEVRVAAEGLALSDVVVACGKPKVIPAGTAEPWSDRAEPGRGRGGRRSGHCLFRDVSPAGRRRRAVALEYEVTRAVGGARSADLAPASARSARADAFDIGHAPRHADGRIAAPVHHGSGRGPAPGRFNLEITVRDLNAATEAVTRTVFVKKDPAHSGT